MNIAIIPARGGSKRIPRKNIKSFCGKPIISYSIKAAQESKLFDRIIVSTEDLNYSFLIKTFGRLSENQKSKIIQILKNTGSLKETG